MQWRLWLKGLIAAVVGGAASAAAVVIVDPQHFNLFQGGARSLAEVSLVFALVSLAAYLKEHPVPDWDGITERRQ